MKKQILLAVLILGLLKVSAQDTGNDPYKMFGHKSTTKYETVLSELLYIKNADTTSSTKALAYDMGSGFAFQLGANDTILNKIKVEPERILRWLSVDPLTTKYPQWSPYAAMGDNPIKNIDPDGRKFVNFDADGNYKNTTKDNWWHNLWHGSQGRVLNSAGGVQQKFRFADPKNDVADIQAGIINKLVFVKESEIRQMVNTAGGFNHKNKTENRGLGFNERYGYIIQAGVAGGKMDFSNAEIPDMYPGASTNPSNSPSPMIFLVDGVAHNHSNFGNFLFRAAGEAMGFSLFELKMGAQYNSLFHSQANGYPSQFDSEDDQYSIKKGWEHANNNKYHSTEWRVEIGPLLHLPTPNN